MLSLVNFNMCKMRHLGQFRCFAWRQLQSGKYVYFTTTTHVQQQQRKDQLLQSQSPSKKREKEQQKPLSSSLTSPTSISSTAITQLSVKSQLTTSPTSTTATATTTTGTTSLPVTVRASRQTRNEGDKEEDLSEESNLKLRETTEKPTTMEYNIDWIFSRLRQPSRFWYLASQLAITMVGLFSKLVLGFMNRTRVYNKERLINLVAKRPEGVPLVTVSNHHSCFDDPGLWGVLPVRYVCNTFKIRWSMAAHDICFTNKYHSLFFMYGKCIPVVRGLGVYQDAVNLCIQKCAMGHWVHVFPEGKVNMTKEEMRLKWGVGRIIYESPRIPIILPMWHEGMDEVLPNVEPYILKWRKKVTLNIGEPLDLNDFIQDLKDRQVPEPEARKLITDRIQEEFRDLRLKTEELHRLRK